MTIPQGIVRLQIWWHANRFAAAYKHRCWRCLLRGPFHDLRDDD